MARILLKLSGEALSGGQGHGFSEEVSMEVAKEIAGLSKKGTEIAIVIGGGNFWRGRTSGDMDRVSADQIGMLATIMNCLYMSDMLRRCGAETVVYNSFECGPMAERFSRDRAVESLKSGKIVFFSGGTSHPYFSTDTTTVLRALEIKADYILLAKAVDGIYSADPKVDSSAIKYDRITMDELVDKRLKALDLSASIMCLENKMPFIVFKLDGKGSILSAVPDDNGDLPKGFAGTVVTV